MIRFRYQPTFEDWFAFNRIVVLRQLRFLNLLAIALFALFLITPFVLRAGGQGEESILTAYQKSVGVLFVPGVAAFVLVATFVGVRKRWKSAAEIREAREYEIDEHGVRVFSVSLSGHHEWRLFTRAERRKGFFLLRTARNQFHYFPESVVPDKKALDALLATKVSSGKG